MGQKVSPIGFRIGIMENWRSRWIADKQDFGRLLVEDQKVRSHIRRGYQAAGIPQIEIERLGDDLKVLIHAARPALIIGRKGAKVDVLRDELQVLTRRKVAVDIKQIATPELSAQVVAEGIAEQLKRRASFRRVIKNALKMARDAGALGVKVQISGRLGGAEMSRTEVVAEGKIPLQTLRARIDYALALAQTTYGIIGVKVWIFLGYYSKEELNHGPNAEAGQAS